MNKLTADMVQQLKSMVDLKKDLSFIAKEKPDHKDNIELVRGYLDYEIARSINDIIHSERL